MTINEEVREQLIVKYGASKAATMIKNYREVNSLAFRIWMDRKNKTEQERKAREELLGPAGGMK